MRSQPAPSTPTAPLLTPRNKHFSQSPTTPPSSPPPLHPCLVPALHRPCRFSLACSPCPFSTLWGLPSHPPPFFFPFFFCCTLHFIYYPTVSGLLTNFQDFIHGAASPCRSFPEGYHLLKVKGHRGRGNRSSPANPGARGPASPSTSTRASSWFSPPLSFQCFPYAPPFAQCVTDLLKTGAPLLRKKKKNALGTGVRVVVVLPCDFTS